MQNDWGNENAAARLQRRRESHSPVTELRLADVCVCKRGRGRREKWRGMGVVKGGCEVPPTVTAAARQEMRATLMPSRVPDR